MKKLSYFVTFIIVAFIFSINAFAKEIVIITGEQVRFRRSATTSSGILAEFYPGDELDLVSKNGGTGNGCSLWYKATYNGKTGYVCSEYVKIKEIIEINPDDYKDYQEYLTKAGFPKEYISSLVKLHQKHPNWDFKILNTELDFNKMINLEYDGYFKGWSLLEDYNNSYDGYKSTDSWSYNYLTDVFSNKFDGGGYYWFAANKKTIAYYLDPRNFLNESNIFMFETLSYNPLYHTLDGVQVMLKGTFMETGYADVENKKTYADAFMDAAIKYKVSPYVLVSRVIQEVGSNGSTIVSGTFKGYEGYYNFYNIKASADGGDKEETIRNGLAYAKSQGWDNQYKAIVGGGSFLSNDYILAGQDTLYLQKWDVFGPNYVHHQYMQNIQAPVTESLKTYRGYVRNNLLENKFVFSIPVFKNMPSETSLPDKGNPNNYLSSLAVNGNYLFKEATTKTSFDINLDSSTSSILISASKVSAKSTISGTGTVSLSGLKQTVVVTVVAQNGDKREYKINISRDSGVSLDISEILRVLNIKNDGSIITGFKVGTDSSTIIKMISEKELKAKVSYFDKDGKEKNSGIIATGDKINIKTDREEKNYTLVIYGDINGDGKIDKLDYLQILRHYYKYTALDGIFKASADINKDGVVDKLDYLAVLRDYYGYAKIDQ